MSSLHPAVGDYLAMRRALGFKLDREEKLLPRFADFIADRGEQHVTVDAAVAWAALPAGSARWWASRLQIARGFAATCTPSTRSTRSPHPICCHARRTARRRIFTRQHRSTR